MTVTDGRLNFLQSRWFTKVDFATPSRYAAGAIAGFNLYLKPQGEIPAVFFGFKFQLHTKMRRSRTQSDSADGPHSQ
jgi:hypothetical protein